MKESLFVLNKNERMSGVVYTVSFKFRNDDLYRFYNEEAKRFGGLDFNHKQLLISNTNTNTNTKTRLRAAAASSSATGGASYSGLVSFSFSIIYHYPK